jgi:hypothetical protein
VDGTRVPGQDLRVRMFDASHMCATATPNHCIRSGHLLSESHSLNTERTPPCPTLDTTGDLPLPTKNPNGGLSHKRREENDGKSKKRRMLRENDSHHASSRWYLSSSTNQYTAPVERLLHNPHHAPCYTFPILSGYQQPWTKVSKRNFI